MIHTIVHGNWLLNSFVIVLIIILFFFIKFERKKSDTKEIALIGTMSTIAGISRIPFAGVMSLQPTTFIVMITGYVYGSLTGFIVGALSALVSNFFLGHGPWTPWQMLSWGMCGLISGKLGKNKDKINIPVFIFASAFAGYFFGWTMNIWHWLGFVYPLNLKTFLATYAASFPFDTLHALGNIAFALIFGKSFYLILMRFKKRLKN
jgi:energy-coupling factor transport system substrate-specific component